MIFLRSLGAVYRIFQMTQKLTCKHVEKKFFSNKYKLLPPPPGISNGPSLRHTVNYINADDIERFRLTFRGETQNLVISIYCFHMCLVYIHLKYENNLEHS